MGWRLPPDPGLPEAGNLLDGGAQALVADFLRASGWAPGAIRPTQVYYRPARSLTVRLDVEARRGDGPPQSLLVITDSRAGDPVRLWIFPDDPALPGLASASEAPGRPQVLRYRPRRRAVLCSWLPDGGVVYTKVLPPVRGRRALSAAAALSVGARPDVHLALPAPGPAPGALCLRPLAGRSLRDLLVSGAALPAPARIATLCDDLTAMATASESPLPDSPARVRAETASEAAALAGCLVPDLIPELHKLTEGITHGIDWDAGDRRPVHGDLYEAQILVDEKGHLGVLDLDDLGAGDPLLDAATFSAHLLVLALGTPATASRIHAYRNELRHAFLTTLDASEAALRWREVYSLLLLSPSPFRTLASDWPKKVSMRLVAAIELATQNRRS